MNSGPGLDTDDTAVARFPHIPGEKSQLSSVLQVKAPSSSILAVTPQSSGEGAKTAPLEAMMSGLSVRASSPVLPASLSPVHGQQPLSGEALRRLSESLPQQVQMSASPDAFGAGESSWHHVGLQLAGTFCLLVCRCMYTARRFCTHGLGRCQASDR